MRKLLFHRTGNGRSPVSEFIRSLSTEQKGKVTWVLRRVERDERVSSQYFKKLQGTDGLWEVRVEAGRDAFRLLGFFDGPVLVVLVSGFAKKTEQTPRSEIDTAHVRRQEYFRRKEWG
jgi:phage-related protein